MTKAPALPGARAFVNERELDQGLKALGTSTGGVGRFAISVGRLIIVLSGGTGIPITGAVAVSVAS